MNAFSVVELCRLTELNVHLCFIVSPGTEAVVGVSRRMHTFYTERLLFLGTR
jgi:hypothetical protein